jgi:hypothetical protein
MFINKVPFLVKFSRKKTSMMIKITQDVQKYEKRDIFESSQTGN